MYRLPLSCRVSMYHHVLRISHSTMPERRCARGGRV